MKRRARAVASVGLTVATSALFSSCANTIDQAALDAENTTTSTLFVATGTTDELLDQLVTDAGALSERIVANDGDEELLGRLVTIWVAVRPEVAAAAPGLIGEFDQAMEMLQRGVQKRRPADADKATRNLQTLIAALDDA